MRATILSILTTLALLGPGESTPLAALDKRYTLDSNGIKYKVFEHAATGATTKIVSNSGICETTPGVNQHSGYFSIQLYVDQPIGTGFSYGTDDATSTLAAAPRVWKLLQAFYAQFPEYEGRDFGIFTESYGGHYGPEFAFYFEQQNAAIDAGTIAGEKIKLVALGVNNGWIDPANQYKDYIDYAANNTYKKLITPKQYSTYVSTYQKKCVPAFAKCTGLTGNDAACGNADDVCSAAIESPLESLASFDVYDIRGPKNDPFPPETYLTYLQTPAVMKAIGAQTTYGECPDAPYTKFISSGDRGRSFLPTLSQVIDSGITVLIWAGDADWICNWMGNYRALNSIAKKPFLSAPLLPYTVNGKKYGEYKTSGNLSWLRVYEAGHEVPAYQPEAALAAFISTMSRKPISSS
ncbi:hypothetical protein ACHAP1_000564 [Verticillium nonalfalfae]